MYGRLRIYALCTASLPFLNIMTTSHLSFLLLFIAEGVDQTRGWFFTLHAIATMLFDSVSFKNIISNGLVLDRMVIKCRNASEMELIHLLLSKITAPIPCAGIWSQTRNPGITWNSILGVSMRLNVKFFGTLYNTYSSLPYTQMLINSAIQKKKFQ